MIDASTIDPEVGNRANLLKLIETAREVAKKVAGKQAMMVDAPVSGGWKSSFRKLNIVGVLGAEKATLTFMVGGETKVL